MQFLIVGLDGTDEEALNRRLAVRDKHIELGEQLRQSGNFWYGAALWDDDEKMIGSMLLMDFEAREKLQEWLDVEPYVTGDVWRSVEVRRCNVRDPWQFNRPQEWFESHGE